MSALCIQIQANRKQAPVVCGVPDAGSTPHEVTMETVFILLGALVVLSLIWFKVIRWRWLRNPVEDRWLAARAKEELLHPNNYWGDVDEFTSIPIKDDETLRKIQEVITQLFDSPENFLEPPTTGKNEYPELSEIEKSKVIEAGLMIEKVLPNYSLHQDAPKGRAR
jgi:hypothetical protein